MEDNGRLNCRERQARTACSPRLQWILELFFWEKKKDSQTLPNCAPSGTLHGKSTWTEVPSGRRSVTLSPHEGARMSFKMESHEEKGTHQNSSHQVRPTGILFNKLLQVGSQSPQGHGQVTTGSQRTSIWGRGCQLKMGFCPVCWGCGLGTSRQLPGTTEQPRLPSAAAHHHLPPCLFPNQRIFKEHQFKGAPNYFPGKFIRSRNFKNEQVVDKNVA